MTKYLSIIILTLNIIFSAPVSMDIAERVAENIIIERFVNAYSVNFTISSAEKIKSDNIDLIYLFHIDPVGFVLVAADDRAVPVLAYSFENNFIRENMPENLSYLINQYQSSILESIETNQATDKNILNLWKKYISGDSINENLRNVDPLIPAMFDQGCGWNDDCPEDPYGPCGHVLVGCVAVAMSQIMHYWSFPEIGQGSHGYTSSYGWLEIDFSSAHYDYDAMGDGSDITDAASLLLYHTGVSINMGYGPDVSVAQYYDAFIAMQDYFFYDNNMNEIQDYQYSDEEWKEILINELESYRPIYYWGNEPGQNVGHAWNIDGYQENYFHMNFGWGGQSNGYYTLDAWYSANQGAFINIQPTDINEPRLVLESYESYESDGDMDIMINPGEIFELFTTFNIPSIFNNAENIELILTSEEPGITIINDSYVHGPLLSGESFSNEDAPFIIQSDSNISIGNKTFILSSVAESEDNFYYKEYELEVLVSLNQFGFPIYNASQKTSPLAVDFDGDGADEIIYGDYNGFIHVLNSDGSELVDATFPFDTGNQIWGAMAGADMDGDGLMDIAALSKSKHLYLLDKNGLKVDYNAGMYLLGTPAIGNLDGDPDLEVVFSSYGSPTSGNMVWALNSDGSAVDGFPLDLGEKVKIGVALADFNGNGKDDIVVGTDSDYIHLFYDDGSEALGFPFQAGDKIQSAPAVLDVDGQKVIFVGCNDNKLYAINSDGSLRFSVMTANKVLNSPAFLDHNNSFYVFFSDDNGILYAVDTDGNALNGWPVDAEATISKSVAFSDLDDDGEAEVIALTEMTDVLAYNLDGSSHDGFPMDNEFVFTAAPIVMDMDDDGDLEILGGSVNSLVSIDVKGTGSSDGYWSMYRGSTERTGYYNISGDATEASIFVYPNEVTFLADGIIGGVEMTLMHDNEFSIEMTDMALLAEYLTEGNETHLLVVFPETNLLFSYTGYFEITELIVANSQYEVPAEIYYLYNMGDVNGDGGLNILDVVTLVDIIMSNGNYISAGDINRDGYLNIMDVVQLVNMVLDV